MSEMVINIISGIAYLILAPVIGGLRTHAAQGRTSHYAALL